ncbi:MAG: hypothetical protein H6831_03795 [Planctomycetes bacterium]|nr:hypothetical protein [Planctomycetota bacterium]MCB9903509.1 hypothetical protein [Planctomycetota bacterium]
MRIPSLLPACALLALTATVPMFTAAAAESTPRANVAVDDHHDSALHEAMETLKGAQRSVKKLMGDPVANEAKLMEALHSMEGAALTALGQTPAAPEGVTGKALELHNIGYKSEMAKLLQTILGMQTATLNGDSAALESGYEELNATKKAGHDGYKLDD